MRGISNKVKEKAFITVSHENCNVCASAITLTFAFAAHLHRLHNRRNLLLITAVDNFALNVAKAVRPFAMQYNTIK